jgi:hypothetical protein
MVEVADALATLKLGDESGPDGSIVQAITSTIAKRVIIGRVVIDDLVNGQL